MLQHGGVGGRLQPRPQRRLLLGSDAARAAGNGLALQRARLALLHHGAFDRSHGDVKAASGFSHGLTVSHRSHQAFFQVGRIGTHTWVSLHNPCLPLLLASCSRTRKPRASGLTVVIDNGAPTGYFEDVVSSASDHIDMIKFGWGTALVTADLEQKIACLRAHEVEYFFGGTLFEKYYSQGKVDAVP